MAPSPGGDIISESGGPIISETRGGFVGIGNLTIKAALSGILIAILSEVAKRYPGFGALIASLPLISVLGMIWLWHDRPDVPNMAAHIQSTFWFVLPSLPMFLVMPALLRAGWTFWAALAVGCVLTITLYLAMAAFGPRFGLKL